MKRRCLMGFLLATLALGFWFLGVDRSWFVEKCPTCGYGRDVLQVRAFTIPLNERTPDYTTLLQKVAADVGAACSHPGLMRYHKRRYWGLCICACPCINGTDRIAHDFSWYDEAVASELRALVRTDPSIPDQFVERVIKNHDWDFWTTFVERLRGLRSAPAQQTPNPAASGNGARASLFHAAGPRRAVPEQQRWASSIHEN